MRNSKVSLYCRRAGGQARVADACGVSVQAVKIWASSGSVPVDRIEAFCIATGAHPIDVNASAFNRAQRLISIAEKSHRLSKEEL